MALRFSKTIVLPAAHSTAFYDSCRFQLWKSVVQGRATMATLSSRLIGQPMHYINGSRFEPVKGLDPLNIIEPASGKCHGTTKQADKSTIDEAVKCSSGAFDSWSKMSAFERGKILMAAANIIKDRIEEISELEVFDNGKPIWEARADVGSCVDSLQYFGGLTASLTGDYISMPNQSFAYTVRQPLGVVASIGAWNYPFQIAVWKSAPAIACGNCVVYKPSEYTPLSALILADIYKEAGLPDGVFNVIQGDGVVGKMLCEHPGIAKVSLTGSVPVGVKVLQSCAKDLKHVTLELGGKSPLIIFEDSDLENAIKGTILANFMSQGQVCCNGTRVFVHENIWDDFVGKLVERARSLKVGDPMVENSQIGASIHKAHFDKVMGYIKGATEQGAKILCGGDRVVMEGRLSGGYYIRPCILGDVRDDMKVAKEEVFGPVMCLFKFSSEDEVVKRSNDTSYGLAAGLFTRDVQKAHRVAARLEAGTVWINNYNVALCELPFGGVKMSGIGRENGKDVLNYFTDVKTVYVEMADVSYPY